MSKPAGNHRGVWILALIICFIAGLCMCGVFAVTLGGKPDTSTTSSGADQQKPADAGFNTPVRDGKFEFVVKSADCGKTSVGAAFSERKAQGVYCLVSITVKNIGSKPQLMVVSNQKAKTANGATYAPDDMATITVNSDKNVWLAEVNPGNSIDGLLVFDMPAGAAPASVELHDSAFSGGVTIALK